MQREFHSVEKDFRGSIIRLLRVENQFDAVNRALRYFGHRHARYGRPLLINDALQRSNEKRPSLGRNDRFCGTET